VTVTGRSADQVQAVADEIGGTAVVGDVSRREDVERMIAAAEPIDLLCANAGITSWERSWETDPDEWWRVFEVNVLGAYLTVRLALPAMVGRGQGRIVITGSGASYLAGSTSGAYAGSKAAVGRFGEVLANQLADTGVKVFVISPGLVRTEMTDTFGDDAPGRRRSWPRSSSASSPRAASTRSPAATSTPSTTRPTSSSGGSRASSTRI
jgi:NAD(P)-dependent dehydrogenase (short-subunit alcohol dehydrogenase family)